MDSTHDTEADLGDLCRDLEGIVRFYLVTVFELRDRYVLTASFSD